MQNKNQKIPFALKFLPKTFPILEKVSPKFAGKFALNLFLRPVRFNTPRREKEAIDTATLFNLTIDNEQVNIYQWGKGPAIWVIHGWSGRATQLYEITKALVKKGYCVYGIDAPGHGMSSGKESSALHFEKALQELNRIKGPPFAYIGHSLGGAVGFLAFRNGIKIQKLVSLGAPSIADEIIREMLMRVGAGNRTVKHLKRAFEKKFNAPFFNYTALSWVFPNPNIPILIVHDKDDRAAPFHHGEALAKVLPKAEFFVTQGLGHNRMLRNSEVIEKVINFITEKTKNE